MNSAQQLRVAWKAATVMGRLAELYTPDEARRWLRSPNPFLRGLKPIDLIADGQTEAVLELIDQLLEGAFL